MLVDEGVGSPGGRPWSVIVADLNFNASVSDLDLLAKLGTVAAAAGGPVIAAASSTLIGCDNLASTPDRGDWVAIDDEAAKRWQSLRQNPIAEWIGLALPRVVGRLPYGPGSDPIDSFKFSELSPRPDHESFLWFNPAFACAWLLSAAFAESAWRMQPGDTLEGWPIRPTHYRRALRLIAGPRGCDSIAAAAR